MVRLAYGSDVPQPLLEVLEHHAARLGLPYHVQEALGQSLERAEGFVLAAEQGLGLAYAMNVVYGPPFDALLAPGAQEQAAPRPEPVGPAPSRAQRDLSGHVKDAFDGPP